MQQAYAQQWNAAQQLSYERHTAELTNCIIAFLSPILPTEEEYRIKEATRRQLERLAGKVSPGAKLLAFGSMANGFALKNSDMDLCCLIGKDENGKTPEFNASELVETLGNLIRQETDFTVMPLPKARIPIIKISRPASAELPYEISCDIGFENRLALENTRLLLSYAMVDPPRLRTLVLFLKVWTKRRKLNSPYTGTLSSYGYTLLVLFFLTHVKRPSVLPNLQRIPPPRVLTQEEIELNGHNIYFYDDVATLRQEWASQNTENVGELLMDFFRYFSKEFAYSRDVISLRTEGGLVPKDGDAWSAEVSPLCIEDPFQVGYNVSRTVTKDGLYTIRGEFMRATRILTSKQGRVSVALAELCEEREDI
ncbi:PAP/OAS1 substrate-binding domain-containing protein, partial [Ceraceosorus guamensis]